MPLFEQAAEELLALCDDNQTEALLRCLALISGATEVPKQNRSLIDGSEGIVTYQIDLQRGRTMNSLGLIISVMKKYFPQKVHRAMQGLRPLSSYRGAVFDITEEMEEDLQKSLPKAIEDGLDLDLYRCKSLPNLDESSNSLAKSHARDRNRSVPIKKRGNRAIRKLTLFIGKLDFAMTEDDIYDMFDVETGL